ncbi:putative repeat protein (TIGR01451 family) [Sphingomonas kyeonggiensis]|uniref:Putative repeat protein (TIGR01451 family) n=1 Tax=Sphingomonas kyeonggiensis TaxID=1268553 RepID=A0A7W7NRG8_9SPHN|nr:hypothetical protein [Sphingomonas kyeonggiensis]MBB4839225.1 putative repeat protein (TIGR01451 family) [Sphingomonas kyeonggiensis]
MDGAPEQVSSNPSTLQVAEFIGSRIVARALRMAVVPGHLTPLPFTLTNIGNGRQAFCLSADYPDGTVEGFAIDGDSDGLYDPAHDRMLPDGCTEELEPGQSVDFLAFFRSRLGTVHTLTLIAHPKGSSGGSIGTGPVSTVVTIEPMAGGGDPTLTKSQSVLDPWGGTIPAHGAVVTYTLVATFPGLTANAAVIDPIPAGTRYLPGSLMLDGTALSDASDGDAGSFDGTGIRVALGDVPAATTHSIQFKVTIQ